MGKTCSQRRQNAATAGSVAAAALRQRVACRHGHEGGAADGVGPGGVDLELGKLRRRRYQRKLELHARGAADQVFLVLDDFGGPFDPGQPVEQLVGVLTQPHHIGGHGPDFHVLLRDFAVVDVAARGDGVGGLVPQHLGRLVIDQSPGATCARTKAVSQR